MHNHGERYDAIRLFTGLASTPYALNLMTDAVKDGLRAVRNAIVDKSIVPGAASILCRRLEPPQGTRKFGGEIEIWALRILGGIAVHSQRFGRECSVDVQESLLLLN